MYASLFAPLVVLRSSYFPFIAGKTICFRVLIELALLCFLFHALTGLTEEEKKKLKHPLVIASMIFGAVFLLSAFTGVNTVQSLWSNFERGDGAFQVIHYVIFFILLVVLFPDRKKMDALLLTNIGVSLLMSAYAVGQLVNNGDANAGFFLASSSRVSGTLGNPSYLAAYLLVTLSFVVYFFIHKKALWQRITLGAIFIFETYILLHTGTRAAFLAIIIGAIILCVTNLIITKNKKIRIWLGVGLALVISLPVIFFATPTARIWSDIPLLNRIINYESALTDIKPRLWTWNSALSGFKDSPLIGYGAENFPYPFDKYYNPGHYGIESFFDRTHNIFLEYMITGGIILLLAWLSMFYFYYERLFKRQKDFWWSVLFVVPIMYFAQGFFLFDTLPIYIIFFLFMAFFISQESPVHIPDTNKKKQFSAPVILTFIIITGVIGYSIYYTDYLPARKNYLLTQSLMLQNTFSSQVAQGVKQVTVTPAQIIDAFHSTLKFNSPVGQEETIGMFQKFNIYLVDLIAGNKEAMKDEKFVSEIRKLVNDTNTWFDNNLNLFPGIKEKYLNGGINLRVGLSFGQPDLLARGKKLYKEALEAGPNRLEVIRVLIEVARIEKDSATFETLLAKAKSLRPDIEW